MPLLGATGGNQEPMTFHRSFGATGPPLPTPPQPQEDMAQLYGAQPPPPPVPEEEEEEVLEKPSSKKHKRDRSREKKDKKKRSRSKDREKRSRSRERRKRSKRSRADLGVNGGVGLPEGKPSQDSTSNSSYNDSYNAALNCSSMHSQQPFKFNMPVKTEIKVEPVSSVSGRKRKSRRGNEEDKTCVPGLPIIIPSNLSQEQQQAYLLQLQIEETSRKLRAGGNLGINPDPAKRSLPPEPVYDMHGKRLNTRKVRTRQKLEQQRHELIAKMMKINPVYKPPPDYKVPVIGLHDKVCIPQDHHPPVFIDFQVRLLFSFSHTKLDNESVSHADIKSEKLSTISKSARRKIRKKERLSTISKSARRKIRKTKKAAQIRKKKKAAQKVDETVGVSRKALPSTAHTTIKGMTDERLKAYGLNPKKTKNRSKYKK